MALKIEGIVDGGVHAQKPLGGSSRLKPLQLAFAPSHGQMKVFRRVVFSQPLLARTAQP